MTFIRAFFDVQGMEDLAKANQRLGPQAFFCPFVWLLLFSWGVKES